MAYPFGDIDSSDITKALITVAKNSGANRFRFRQRMPPRRYNRTRALLRRGVKARRGGGRYRSRWRFPVRRIRRTRFPRYRRQRRGRAYRKAVRRHRGYLRNRIPRQIAARPHTKVVTFKYYQDVTCSPGTGSGDGSGATVAYHSFSPLRAKEPHLHRKKGSALATVRAGYNRGGLPQHWSIWAGQFKKYVVLDSAIKVTHFPQHKANESQVATANWGLRLLSPEKAEEIFTLKPAEQTGMPVQTDDEKNTELISHQANKRWPTLRELGLIGAGNYIGPLSSRTIETPRTAMSFFHTRRWFGKSLKDLEQLESRTENVDGQDGSAVATPARVPFEKENATGNIEDVNNDFRCTHQIREKMPTWILWCSSPVAFIGGANVTPVPQTFRVECTYRCLLSEAITIENAAYDPPEVQDFDPEA